MTQFTPEWKLSIDGVEYTDIAISDISHEAGRTDIYQQPNPSYIQVTLVALNDQNLSFDINDGLTLQLKNTSGSYVSIFGGNITDISTTVSITGSIGKVISYTLIALGSLAKLPKAITNGVLSQDFDGDQIAALLFDTFSGSWNEVSATVQWNTYLATTTWATAEVEGVGEIDQPGQYTMENRDSNSDTVYNIAAAIANSAFGYLYEDENGNIGYADAAHRQAYLTANGYVEISANTAIGAGLGTVMRSGDIRNDIAINYGNNYGSQKTATSLPSIGLYGYKAETIQSLIHNAADAQEIADKYITLRAYPREVFEQITFPITNPELDNADRDALLGVFLGQPISITDLPIQINGGGFQGFVEGWNWSTSFNELFLTLNLSPVEYSEFASRWNTVPVGESWNTLSAILEWQDATIVA
jgi:hypothetical protein